ncbi:hypothetical protein [Streptomyces sp. Ncost-T10-10d]|uniref:hypothetical protein n=1 Tax=Streptomyces sp. Ncost-T10-10d TaxID=1839774 RepID=UPI00159F3104|nr:hypothetical protein [Streptomyces sp. Ncost-T10-10d]
MQCVNAVRSVLVEEAGQTVTFEIRGDGEQCQITDNGSGRAFVVAAGDRPSRL